MAKGKNGQKPIGFTIDEATHAAWLEAAKREHRSLAAEIRDAMEERIAKLRRTQPSNGAAAPSDPMEEL